MFFCWLTHTNFQPWQAKAQKATKWESTRNEGVPIDVETYFSPSAMVQVKGPKYQPNIPKPNSFLNTQNQLVLEMQNSTFRPHWSFNLGLIITYMKSFFYCSCTRNLIFFFVTAWFAFYYLVVFATGYSRTDQFTMASNIKRSAKVALYFIK